MKDLAATQRYFLYLLQDSPIPGYVQYFVHDPFLLHMYTAKQIDLLILFKNKAIVLNNTNICVSQILCNFVVYPL